MVVRIDRLKSYNYVLDVAKKLLMKMFDCNFFNEFWLIYFSFNCQSSLSSSYEMACSSEFSSDFVAFQLYCLIV